MSRTLLAVAGLLYAWLWSRGARDPREWPERLPGEIAALRRDIDDSVAAGRRAAVRKEREFDEELRRVRAAR